jgi:Kef-type K+ transport system membrane component KefB
MTSLGHLLGLLLLAYLGTFLVGNRTIRGFGLSSSVEYVVLGFFLGPVLGILDRSALALFDPLTHLAIGWLALLVGLDYGHNNGVRVRLRSGLLGSLMALATFALLFLELWALLPSITPLPPRERTILAAGVAVACTETTHHAVRWVVERYQAEGPLARLFGEMTDVEDMVPILACAVIFALNPTPDAPLPPLPSALVSLGLGVGIGLLTAALLGREFRLDESWRLLLGASLLTIGLSVQTKMSPLTTLFAMGVTISISSGHRMEIVAMTAPTERAVLLPALLVAGARLDLTTSSVVPTLALLAVLGRLGAKLLCGAGLRALLPEARATQPWMGLSLVSAGGLAMSIGLAFNLRFPGLLGDAVLASAAAATLLGEFIGPPSLRATLARNGEIAGPTTTPPPLVQP